jgi:hypothetical protein
MDIRKEVSAETGTQQWHKELRPEPAATKQGGIDEDHQEIHWTGDREANCQIYSWITDNQGLDLVEGPAPSKMEEEPASTGSIR